MHVPASEYIVLFVITRAEGTELRFQLCVFFYFILTCFCRCQSWSVNALLSMTDQFEPHARNKMPGKKPSFILVAYHNLDFILSLIQLE